VASFVDALAQLEMAIHRKQEMLVGGQAPSQPAV
jgi:hypothetical protein